MPDPAATWRRLGALGLKARDCYYATRADLLNMVTEGTVECLGTAETYRNWGCDPVVIWNAREAVTEPVPLPEVPTIGYIGNVREVAMFRWLVEAIALLPPESRPA